MFSIKTSIHYSGRKLPLDEFVDEYNILFQESVNLFTEFAPCRVHDHICMRGRANLNLEFKNFCCGGCQYLTDEGCVTNSIWCKLWVCESMRVKHDEFWDRRAELKQRAHHLCRGRAAGRYGLNTYIKDFYSRKEYEAWKTTEGSTMAASSM